MSRSLISSQKFSPVQSLKLPDVSAKKFFHKILKKCSQGQLRLIDGEDEFIFGNVLDSQVKAVMKIEDPRCYSHVLLGGSIGIAEAYMQGMWTTDDLSEVVRFFSKNLSAAEKVEGAFSKVSQVLFRLRYFFEKNSITGSKKNIVAHYDLGNDFFKLFLDQSMMYSMAIFADSQKKNLAQAQELKLKTICEKLQLKSSDHLLEIGTGWGGLACYAAEHYGCKVTTTTISDEQFSYTAELIKGKGLTKQITLLKQDYRLLEGTYDKLVSIEMIEAVGADYFGEYFRQCSHLLRKDGIFLMQVITIPDQRFERARKEVDFIKRYIFPGCCIPSIYALSSSAMSNSSFRIIDLKDYAEDYADTLKCWKKRFEDNQQEVQELTDETFFKMWQMYFTYCEGGFRERIIGCSQILFANTENRG